MKQKIRVWFTDFWPVFKLNKNFILDILDEKYQVILDKEKPDFLFYSNFGIEYKKYHCVKIFFTGENVRPDFTQCDYALSFDFSDNPRNYRYPLYAVFNDVNKLTLPKPDFESILKYKTKFCNFVYSNPTNPVRNNFFKKLSKYKKVDSAGRLYKNTQFAVKDKLDFIKDYKFTIAFENESYPGYTSEKIFEPMLVHSMPIYWGNPLIYKDFNTKSFVNYYDFANEEDLIDYIIELDKDPDKYYLHYKHTYFEDNKPNKYVVQENLYRQLDKIFNTRITPVSSFTPAAGESELNKKLWHIENTIDYYSNEFYQKINNFNFCKLKIKLMKKFNL